MLKSVRQAVAITVFTIGLAGTAVATSVNPIQGGTWNYGTSGTATLKAYSNYLHNTKCHGSSVGRNGTIIVRSINTAPKGWSIAEKYHAPWTGSWQFYYRLETCP